MNSPSSNCSLIPPAGESREGGSPLWWGLGGTPQPLSAPLPAREAGGCPERQQAHPDVESGLLRVRDRSGIKFSASHHTSQPPCASQPEPYDGFPPGGRVQRGRSPLLWGLWGYTPNPYPLRFLPEKQADVRRWDGRTPMRSRGPYEYGAGRLMSNHTGETLVPHGPFDSLRTNGKDRT